MAEEAQEGAGQGEVVEPAEVIMGIRTLDTATELAAVEMDIQETVANSIVKNHVIASIGWGLVPVPLFDLSALMMVQMNMLRGLQAHYGIPADEKKIKPLLLILTGGSLPVMSVVGLSSFAKLIPGIGSLAGSASVGVLGGAVTYALGQTFIMHFEVGGTLEDFNPKQMQAFFNRELEAGKAVVRGIKEEIKTVKPSSQQVLP